MKSLYWMKSEMTSTTVSSLKHSLYLTDGPKTFSNDATLPALPVPDLKHTIELYLNTVKPLVNEKEYQETAAIAERFLNGVGPKLQEALVRKSESNKNWLEDWWLEYAYLRQRAPLIPYSNMSAPAPKLNNWPPRSGSRIERCALNCAFDLEFWKMLRTETMRPIVHKEVNWAMDQFKRLFNTCRIPGVEKDSLQTLFLTESEGALPPTNIIVLYRGYIFSFEAVQRESEQPLSASEIASQLYEIEKWCKAQPSFGPGVGALTTTNRTKWAKNRDYLIRLHSDNLKSLRTIEKSLRVIVLQDNEPITQNEIMKEVMCGDCTNRWADKSLSTIVFNNGLIGGNTDHTPFDGLCTAILSHYVLMSFDEPGVLETLKGKCTNLIKPVQIVFKLDDYIYQEISNAKKEFLINCQNIDIVHSTFKSFGKAFLKEPRFHPEAFIQVALQLAYYRLHGKPAPTYCTASTRQYYHGRTETCRSCFPESIEFIEIFLQQHSSPGEIYFRMRKAIEKFQKVMNLAMDGYGCDRHFLGLYLTSLEEGVELPEIFTDPSFTKTGGNGSYVLSTSCSGYWNMCGGVPPMREDGYGVFYGIEDNQVTFCVISFKKCSKTDSQVYFNSICHSLMDMQKILAEASKL